MNPHRVEITLPQELWARLESARGHEPRASFVRRAVVAFLDDAGSRRMSPEALALLKAAWDSPALEKQFHDDSPVVDRVGAVEVVRPPVIRAPVAEEATAPVLPRHMTEPVRLTPAQLEVVRRFEGSVPGVQRASSLAKRDVKPIPKKGSK